MAFKSSHPSPRSNKYLKPLNLSPPHLAVDIIADSQNLFKSFEDVLISQGLLNDALVMGATTTMGDIVAQCSQQASSKAKTLVSEFTASRLQNLVDLSRTQRFGMFGLVDGMFSHTWAYFLASFIHGTSTSDVLKGVAADCVFYTPIWSVWFLFAMATMERRCMNAFKDTFPTEWQSLTTLTNGFYVPLNCLVFATVPVEYRVTTYAFASLLFTIGLSFWSSTSDGKEEPPVKDVKVENNTAFLPSTSSQPSYVNGTMSWPF